MILYKHHLYKVAVSLAHSVNRFGLLYKNFISFICKI